MQQQTNLSHGLKWGLLIGAAYIILLYARYASAASNPIMMGLWTLIGYGIVVAMLAVCGFKLRKKNGGIIDVKEAFKVLFLAVLIFELCYTVFNFIYLKYINPNFFKVYRDSMAVLLEKSGQPQARTDEMLKTIDVDAGSQMSVFDLLKAYLVSISVSGIVALILALIIKKKPAATSTGSFS